MFWFENWKAFNCMHEDGRFLMASFSYSTSSLIQEAGPFFKVMFSM